MEGLCRHCCDRLGAYIFMVMLCQVSIIHLFHKSVHTIYMLPAHSVGKTVKAAIVAGLDLIWEFTFLVNCFKAFTILKKSSF